MKIDSVLVRLNRAITAQKISKDGIFYELLNRTATVCEANGKSISWEGFPKLWSLSESIAFYGGPKVLNLLIGDGYVGKGSQNGGEPNWKRVNFNCKCNDY